MRTLWLLWLAACRTGDLQVSQDLSGGSRDLASDLASAGMSSVECGMTACVAPSPVCCRASPFGDGVCIAAGTSCGSATWPCDDPGDCGGGQVCCNTTSGSSCQSEAQCAAMNGRRMCLDGSQCKMGEQCCGQGPSPSFYCGNTCPISRKAYKDDIEYLDAPSLQSLHDQLLQYRLSRYHYRVDPAHQRLGFIIDDVGASPAVAPDGDHVDLYGYASMAVAALQVQAREIAALKEEVRALKVELKKRRK